jgi:hypothetical protein
MIKMVQGKKDFYILSLLTTILQTYLRICWKELHNQTCITNGTVLTTKKCSVFTSLATEQVGLITEYWL